MGRGVVQRTDKRRGRATRGTRVAPLVGALFAVVLVAAGPGASALGVARSMQWRARPYRVTAGSAALPEAFLQHGPRDCGPAALATVLAWRGRPAGEGPILRLARLRADGVSLAEMVRLSSAFELPGAWYAVPRRKLGALPTPFIAHMRAGRRFLGSRFLGSRLPGRSFPGSRAGDRGAGHFVAVRRVVRGFVLLADPARGLVLEREARFARSWSGRVLLFDPVVAAARAGAPRAPQHAAQPPAQHHAPQHAGSAREGTP